jgi:hypothetical protein
VLIVATSATLRTSSVKAALQTPSSSTPTALLIRATAELLLPVELSLQVGWVRCSIPPHAQRGVGYSDLCEISSLVEKILAAALSAGSTANVYKIFSSTALAPAPSASPANATRLCSYLPEAGRVQPVTV